MPNPIPPFVSEVIWADTHCICASCNCDQIYLKNENEHRYRGISIRLTVLKSHLLSIFYGNPICFVYQPSYEAAQLI